MSAQGSVAGVTGLMARLRGARSFWRFALIGGAGFFVDLATLYLALFAGMDRISGRVPAFLAAATVTWWLNRRFNFGASGRSPLAEWASFLGANAFGQMVNFATYALVIVLLPPWPWTPAIGVAAGAVAGLVLNYRASRTVVFRQR